MTKIFKAQLLNELRQAGFADYAEHPEHDGIIPYPQYPDLVITQQHVQFGENASQQERDLAHGTASAVLRRTRESCHAWDSSTPFPKTCDAPENFNMVAEFGEVVMAVHNDGERGLHFVTWDYDPNHTGVE